MSQISQQSIQRARDFLKDGYTCALIKNGQSLLSKQRGVVPLLEWLNTQTDCTQAIAADKVVGKAAAYLYVLLGVSFVYANVISESAAQVFERFDVAYDYGEKVAAIRNRAGDGFCPMEQAVLNIDEPNAAYARIEETLQDLKRSANAEK